MGKHSTPEGDRSTSEQIKGHKTPMLPNDYEPKHDKSDRPAGGDGKRS